MTGKADFSEQEWKAVLEGPPSAAMIVMMAQLDELVSAKPQVDHTRYHSAGELTEHGLKHLRDAIEILERKATPDEVSDYRHFVRALAEKVANAHREDGVAVSPAEQAAIEEVSAALGASDPQ
jgi:hypothetical protein